MLHNATQPYERKNKNHKLSVIILKKLKLQYFVTVMLNQKYFHF